MSISTEDWLGLTFAVVHAETCADSSEDQHMRHGFPTAVLRRMALPSMPWTFKVSRQHPIATSIIVRSLPWLRPREQTGPEPISTASSGLAAGEPPHPVRRSCPSFLVRRRTLRTTHLLRAVRGRCIGSVRPAICARLLLAQDTYNLLFRNLYFFICPSSLGWTLINLGENS